MTLKTSLTGSYPPIKDPDISLHKLDPDEQESIVRAGIQRAVGDQIEVGIDFLVDGQVRDDIVSLYSWKLPGFESCTIPCRVIGRVRPAAEAITAADYSFAKSLAGGRPLKAHLTGPMTLARGSIIDQKSPYTGRSDPKLIDDFAQALGAEANFLVQAGAEIVQIDEPALQDGVNLELAFRAMKTIFDLGKVKIPALHACGNVTQILEKVLTEAPVRMVSIEGAWLSHDSLQHIDRAYLSARGKQIGLGCIQVIDYKVDKLTRVQNFLDHMTNRLGEENIWAVMPNCGMRPIPYEIAKEKLRIMVKAAQTI